MSSGFLCERCGAMYGVRVLPNPERQAEMEACVSQRCLPIREILTRHAAQLRADGPRSGVSDWQQVALAIETSDARWRKRFRSWAESLAQSTSTAETPAGMPSVVGPPDPPPAEWPSTNEAIKALCDVWIARWGAGSAPGDVIRNAALHLKREGAPWDAVLRSFQRYVDTVQDAFASPYNWRKRWSAFDPEQPEFDHEAAQIRDSIDRQARQRRRGGGGELMRVVPPARQIGSGRK